MHKIPQNSTFVSDRKRQAVINYKVSILRSEGEIVMCGSNGSGDCCCCPDAVVLQEKVCGNIKDRINQAVWTAPTVNDYIQGTFEVFNAGPGDIEFSVNGVVFTVPPGNSKVVSVNNPTIFIIQTFDFPGAQEGTSGKWCITLYKRVFA